MKIIQLLIIVIMFLCFSSAFADTGPYVNKEYGFSIKWPDNWFKRNENIGGKTLFSIVYARNKVPPAPMDIPLFGLLVLPPHRSAKTPLEIANTMFSQWKASEKKYEIAESPTEFEINGIKGARFIWDKPAWDNSRNQEFWVRMLNVYFINNGKVFYLNCFVLREEFENIYKEIQDSLQSLRFTIENDVSDNATADSHTNEIVQQGEIFTAPYGFQFQYPPGWHSQNFKGAPLFTKQAGAGISFPCLILSMDHLPPGMRSAVEFAQLVLPDYEAGARKAGGAFRIVEPIHEIEAGGVKGARFVYERTSPDERNMKNFDCKFLVGDGKIVSFQGMDTISEFDQSLPIFEKAISSFKLTDSALNTKTPGETEYQRKLSKAMAESAKKYNNNPPLVYPKGEEQFDASKFNASGLNFAPTDSAAWGNIKSQVIGQMEKASSFRAFYIQKDKNKKELTGDGYKSVTWFITFVAPQDFEVTQITYKPGYIDIWRVVGDNMFNNFGIWVPAPGLGSGSNPAVEQIIKTRLEIYKMLSFQNYLELLKQQAPFEIAKDAQNSCTVAKFKISDPSSFFLFQKLSGSSNDEAVLWISDKDKTILYANVKVSGKRNSGENIDLESEHYFKDYNAQLKVGKPDMPWLEETEQVEKDVSDKVSGPGLMPGGVDRKKYTNLAPYFVLRIPEDTGIQWEISILEPNKNFVIDSLDKTPLMLISGMIDQLSDKELAMSPEHFFRSAAAQHEQSEQELMRQEKGELKIVNNGSSLNIGDFKAYERSVEFVGGSGSSIMHHYYILIDKHLLQMAFSAKASEFSKGDQDFKNIVYTLSTERQ